MNDRSASSSAKAPRRTSADAGGGSGAEFAAALLVREHSVHHFCTQLLLSNLSQIAFLLIMGRGHARFPAVVACTALYFATLAAYAARLQPPASVRWSALCIWTHTAVTLCVMFGVMHAMWTDRGSCPGLELAGCLRVYSRVVHASCMCLSRILAQMPTRLLFFPGLLVDATCAAVVLAAAHLAGVLTPAYAAGVCAEAAACVTLLPLFTKFVYEPPPEVMSLLADVETCPRGFLRRWRDASVNAGAHLRRRFFDDVALFEARWSTPPSSAAWPLPSTRFASAASPCATPASP